MIAGKWACWPKKILSALCSCYFTKVLHFQGAFHWGYHAALQKWGVTAKLELSTALPWSSKPALVTRRNAEWFCGEKHRAGSGLKDIHHRWRNHLLLLPLSSQPICSVTSVIKSTLSFEHYKGYYLQRTTAYVKKQASEKQVSCLIKIHHWFFCFVLFCLKQSQAHSLDTKPCWNRALPRDETIFILTINCSTSGD